MKTSILFCWIILISTIPVFSQTSKKIDEIGDLACDDYKTRTTDYFVELKNEPQNKLHIIYYEGQKRPFHFFDKKTQKLKTISKRPRFGDALNKAKSIQSFLKFSFKVPYDRVVLVDGGFREYFYLEIWSVPDNAESPKATPTLQRKDIKFERGKPGKVLRFQDCHQ